MTRQTAKQCQQCGKPYVGGNATKFCGDACRKLARPESYYRPQLTCLQCGTKYKGRAESKYCSDRCKGEAYSNFTDTEQLCGGCDGWKPHAAFGKNQARPSGLDHLCKQCRARQAAKSMRGGGRYSRAKAIAKKRRHGWELSREEFEALISQPCYYCGFPINETGIGLDRIDDSGVYRAGSVLPACGECNRIRSDKYTVAEMQLIGKALAVVKRQRLEAGLPLPKCPDEDDDC
ncbi:MAG: hypothetical protein U0792_19750 [Gemmataceae bacterium]